jgi:hypothetical protein
MSSFTLYRSPPRYVEAGRLHPGSCAARPERSCRYVKLNEILTAKHSARSSRGREFDSCSCFPSVSNRTTRPPYQIAAQTNPWAPTVIPAGMQRLPSIRSGGDTVQLERTTLDVTLMQRHIQPSSDRHSLTPFHVPTARPPLALTPTPATKSPSWIWVFVRLTGSYSQKHHPGCPPSKEFGGRGHKPAPHRL